MTLCWFLFSHAFFLAEATDNTEEKPVTTPLLEHMKQKYMTREAKSVCGVLRKRKRKNKMKGSFYLDWFIDDYCYFFLQRAAKAKRPRNVREIQKKKPAGGKDPNMPPQKV